MKCVGCVGTHGFTIRRGHRAYRLIAEATMSMAPYVRHGNTRLDSALGLVGSTGVLL
jgi:hypothetical protein